MLWFSGNLTTLKCCNHGPVTVAPQQYFKLFIRQYLRYISQVLHGFFLSKGHKPFFIPNAATWWHMGGWWRSRKPTSDSYRQKTKGKLWQILFTVSLLVFNVTSFSAITCVLKGQFTCLYAANLDQKRGEGKSLSHTACRTEVHWKSVSEVLHYQVLTAKSGEI